MMSFSWKNSGIRDVGIVSAVSIAVRESFRYGNLATNSGSLKAAVQSAVAEINAGRAQVYREAAAKTGVTAEAAGASAYNQVVQSRLKPGEYYRPAGAGWMRK